MEFDSRRTGFLQGADMLPRSLREQVLRISEREQAQVEEIRLRTGQPVSVLLPDGERSTGTEPVRTEHLQQLLEIASGASVHTVLEQLREGFLTVAGGHRIGFCGTAVMGGGEITMLREFSSASIRIARQFPDISREILPKLLEEHRLQSTLIIAPPGGGKTSLLRDLIRGISCGRCGVTCRVGVVDQRGELAAMYRGRAQLDVGPCTDVMSGCPKAEGLMVLLRGMNPQVLAVDEVTAAEDAAALITAAGCGVALLATAHAGGKEELLSRPVYRSLLEQKIFRRLVTIRGRGAQRCFHTEVLE